MSQITNNKLEFKNLSSKSFRIPYYQRPYVWGDDDVEIFVKDILDLSGNYSIGVIIVDQNGEVIDGQQRLTTLFLLCKVLGVKCYNLEYEIRDADNKFLQNPNQEIEACDELKRAHKIMTDFAAKDAEKLKKNIQKIFCYLTTLSSNDDAMNFFENMNEKKMQLRQSDLIKAYFVKNCDKKISKIWNECFDKFDDSNKSEFNPIIDIDLFLLHVLKLYCAKNMSNKIKDVELSSKKKVLKNYETIFGNLAAISDHTKEEFADLLSDIFKIFKKEIIQRDSDNNDIATAQIQTLLYVSSAVENPWLSAYLKFLMDDNSDKKKFLTNLVIKFAQNRYNEESEITKTVDEYLTNGELKIDDVKINLGEVGHGTNTAHFWFYFVEYVLWWHLSENGKLANKIAKEFLFGDTNKITNYKITSQQSIEHFCPQSRVDECLNGDTEILDNFGNLALISRDFNSSLSNLKEVNKRIEIIIKFQKSSVSSLKMLLFYTNAKEPVYNEENITAHLAEIQGYLDDFLEARND